MFSEHSDESSNQMQ